MRKAARTVKPNARTGERHTWKDRERRRKEERKRMAAEALIVEDAYQRGYAEFGYSDKSEQFWKSYECLKTHLSLSSEYTGGETPDSTDDEVNEEDIKNLFG